jgi:hypothetical protein
MNKRARQFFVKWIEAKYSLGVDLKQDQYHYNIIREMDIFQAIKNVPNVPNVWMVPGSYHLEIPSVPISNRGGIREITQPWGPTVTFKVQSRAVQTPTLIDERGAPKLWGDPKIMQAIKTALNTSLGQYIHAVGVEYDTDSDNGTYDVTITTKR